MFPVNWDPTHTTRKRRRTFLEECEGQAAARIPRVAFSSGLEQTILRRLNTGGPPPGGITLPLDHVLSRVPYKTMLENLFQQGDDPSQAVRDVPILTRAYEESFMRQALPGERSCAMGDMCECMHIDKSSPFIGVELRLPNDPEETQLCVLCSRSTTQKCFYDMCYLGQAAPAIIQRYGSLYGQPGEYAVDCMLIPTRAVGPAHMPVPAMSHQRNRYSVVVIGGFKHLKQHRVGFEDFHSPSGKGVV